MFNRILLSVMLAIASGNLYAEQSDGSNNSDNASAADLAKYVSINIEIKELRESGQILKDASQTLSTALKHVSEDLDDLSPEQLRLVNELADKVDRMTDKLNAAVNSFPNTIERAQGPSNELLKQSLSTVRAETVDPIVSSVNRWLIITIIGLVLLGSGLLAGFIFAMRKLSVAGNNILRIADGYRVIPVEQYIESQTPTTEKTATKADS